MCLQGEGGGGAKTFFWRAELFAKQKKHTFACQCKLSGTHHPQEPGSFDPKKKVHVPHFLECIQRGASHNSIVGALYGKRGSQTCHVGPQESGQEENNKLNFLGPKVARWDPCFDPPNPPDKAYAGRFLALFARK